MLVLSRKVGESLIIDGGIRIEVLESRGPRVRLGITAPREVAVLRGELAAAMEAASVAPVGAVATERRTAPVGAALLP